MKTICYFFIFLLLSVASSGRAGTTGKLEGLVTDKATGLPLPGSEVILKQTRQCQRF